MIGSCEKKEIVKRFHHIKGQLGGIEKMLAEDRSLKQVYEQLRAVEQALHQVLHVLLDDYLKREFAEALAKRLAACPGDCDDAERLQFLRHEFSRLDLKGLIAELTWLRDSQSANHLRKPKPRKEVKSR